jgi:dolichyl-diphosphooligosaccharide--protein glycosyltransferase
MPSVFAIKQNTPQNAIIWSNWNSGYVTTFYANRSTTIDGGNAIDLERHIYQAIPLASHSQQQSANFIKFFAIHGKVGMRQIYALFDNPDKGLKFIKQVLSLTPQQAKKVIIEELPQQNLQFLLKFLFPKTTRPIYLLINPLDIRDGTWYSNGTWDINNKKGNAVIFANFHNVQEKNKNITSNGLNFSIEKGLKTRIGSSTVAKRIDRIKHLFTRTEKSFTIKNYPNGGLAFEWITPFKYGALMDLEVSKSVLNTLFIRHSYQPKYFKPIKLKTPHYQIWQVIGDVY